MIQDLLNEITNFDSTEFLHDVFQKQPTTADDEKLRSESKQEVAHGSLLYERITKILEEIRKTASNNAQKKGKKEFGGDDVLTEITSQFSKITIKYTYKQLKTICLKLSLLSAAVQKQNLPTNITYYIAHLQSGISETLLKQDQKQKDAFLEEVSMLCELKIAIAGEESGKYGQTEHTLNNLVENIAKFSQARIELDNIVKAEKLKMGKKKNNFSTCLSKIELCEKIWLGSYQLHSILIKPHNLSEKTLEDIKDLTDILSTSAQLLKPPSNALKKHCKKLTQKIESKPSYWKRIYSFLLKLTSCFTHKEKKQKRTAIQTKKRKLATNFYSLWHDKYSLTSAGGKKNSCAQKIIFINWLSASIVNTGDYRNNRSLSAVLYEHVISINITNFSEQITRVALRFTRTAFYHLCLKTNTVIKISQIAHTIVSTLRFLSRLNANKTPPAISPPASGIARIANIFLTSSAIFPYVKICDKE